MDTNVKIFIALFVAVCVIGTAYNVSKVDQPPFGGTKAKGAAVECERWGGDVFWDHGKYLDCMSG